MSSVKPFDHHVVARMQEFFAPNTGWQRTLWDIGSVLVLKELLEAADATRDGFISDQSLRYLCSHAKSLIGPDQGIDGNLKPEIEALLSLKDQEYRELTAGGEKRARVEAIIPIINRYYFTNWKTSAAGITATNKSERVARLLAAHMLSLGYSAQFLNKWLSAWTKRHTGSFVIADLISDLDVLANFSHHDYSGLVVFEAAPSPNSTPPMEWQTAAQVSTWFDLNGFSQKGVRQVGGWLMAVQQVRDPYVAVEKISDTIARIAARATIGSKRLLRPIEKVWIAGEREPFPLRHSRRSAVEVGALERENKIYAVQAPSVGLDGALELLSTLENGPPGPAVASGWAAIECLLHPRGDEKVIAGDRLAMILACSVPRAELTTLAFSHKKTKRDSLATSIENASSNYERAHFMLEAIKRKEDFSHLPAKDLCGLNRIEEILKSPRKQLRDIENYAKNVLRRLYRQRNIIMHGGKIDSVVLSGVLRSSAPLVGAGMDRIAHAWFVENLSPIELVSRAKLRIALSDTSIATDLISLLEP